ncbi:hypothetical protein [Bifidobacterium tsurumiense]|uniref:hypothetical protein n=1 Tax=Bifidobacterium tsurumiense TaxID=356829 RepID=UPI00040D52ED|nr:hypothetical protein [Bifidobacterium tsurumiense]MDY4678794.1 hypothetical protein [Bifidobacterium tsurumiense]
MSSACIKVKEDDFGDATVSTPVHELPFPAGSRLVPFDEAPGQVLSSSSVLDG